MTPCKKKKGCGAGVGVCDWWSQCAAASPVVSQMLLFVLLPGALLADLRQSLFLEEAKTGEKRKEGVNLRAARLLLPLPAVSPPH